jgi:1-aminocyclopropane-1-carboxylate deaminase
MEIFSPIHQIQLPSQQSIWVKRDDLIDPYISGNKWRKLKYILKTAKKLHKNHLVTFGGAFSNHLVATAAAASRNKLKATAFVRGEEVTNEMLLICKLFGMRLIFVDRESYRDKQNLFNQTFGNDNDAYFIDEGGASEEAVKGCSEIIEELPTHFDHIFCAAGTGTTAAGLLKGIIKNHYQAQLHIVSVLKGGEFLTSEIGKYENDQSKLTLHHEYHFGGYAKTTSELLNFIKIFTQSTGMLIDPVYTGKMFYAINDLANKNYFQQDAKILAIHTGGLLGIFGMKEKLTGILG